MKKSDIYEIAIKILGLYLVITVIELLKELLTYSTILLQYKNNPGIYGGVNQVPVFIVTVLNFVLVTVFAGLLIFKTKKLTSLICKKEDFIETAKLFTDKKTIIEIALIIVGLVTIILTIPEFGFKLKNYIYIAQNGLTSEMRDKNFLIIAGLKILIGVIAVCYSKAIASSLTKDKTVVDKESDQ
jgi:hypothetical protein